jgi:hypothetical protein
MSTRQRLLRGVLGSIVFAEIVGMIVTVPYWVPLTAPLLLQ